ncbi:hypothetical protein XENOCAPTIV_007634, partial [Xenoophorus captivus]
GVCLAHTSMVNHEQLLPVPGHAHYRPRHAEDLSLDASDGKQPEQQRAGGDGRPALTQTQRLHVLALRQVHHPFLIGVPGGEVEALQLTGNKQEPESCSLEVYWNEKQTRDPVSPR